MRIFSWNGLALIIALLSISAVVQAKNQAKGHVARAIASKAARSAPASTAIPVAPF